MRSTKSKIDESLALANSLLRSDPHKASRLVAKAFKESQSAQYMKGQADSLMLFSQLISASEASTSYDFAQKAIDLYRQIGDEFCEASSLMIIARYYENLGWTTRSHYVLQEAYGKARKTENRTVEAAALYNLGANAEDREDYVSALSYFSLAKDVAKKAEIMATMWRAECAVQEMHYVLQDGKFAPVRIVKAVKYFVSEEMEGCLVEVYVFLAKVARNYLDLKIARQYLRLAYSLAKGSKDIQGQLEIIARKGEYRLFEGKPRSAERLLELAISSGRSAGVRSVEISCMKLLARSKYALGKTEDAFRIMSDYAEYKDSLNAHESRKHFEEIKTAHQVHLIEEESRALKQTNTDLAAMNDRLEAALLEKRTLQKELERLVTIDELTGALNRRELLSCGAEIISRFHTQNRPAVVMIVDIDHFKTINDNFSHSVGDEVLRRFTKSCQRVLRPTDRFGRLGGEEFCILLDRTDLDIALKVAERVMQSIRTCRVADILGDRLVTASIGIVEVSKSHDTIEIALHDADLGLYQAKRTGRDKICVTTVKKKKAA
jgi:diguanylate cyclase (GGDEF)-like protein